MPVDRQKPIWRGTKHSVTLLGCTSAWLW